MSSHLASHDPYIAQWQANGATLAAETDLDRAVIDADCAVVLHPHRACDLAAIGQRRRGARHPRRHDRRVGRAALTG